MLEDVGTHVRRILSGNVSHERAAEGFESSMQIVLGKNRREENKPRWAVLEGYEEVLLNRGTVVNAHNRKRQRRKKLILLQHRTDISAQ